MTGAVSQATVDQITADIAKIGGNIKALDDQTRRELHEMRSIIDDSGKKLDAVAEERINKFTASIETKHLALEKGVQALTDSLEQTNAVLKRPGVQAGWAAEEEGKKVKDAFAFHKAKMAKNGQLTALAKVDPSVADQEGYQAWADGFAIYMRRDERGVPQAALQTGSDPDGGYLVPTTVSQRVVTKSYESSPLRAFATVETIAGKDLDVPRDEGEFGYGWVGETATRAETDTAQLGVSKIVAHEMYAAPRATQAMLEDAGIDLEAWIARKVGERFGRVEATSFITGTGVGQPRGIMTYASGTTNGTIEQIVSGSAAALTADGIKDLVFSLKDYYAANARFMMKRTTVRDVMKLKDTTNQYLWQPSMQAGQPALLEGYPVVRAEDVAAIAANALPIVFGDFAAAYTIVDRLGISLLRDPFSAKPYVIFYTRRRVGGDVVNFEAVKIQKCST